MVERKFDWYATPRFFRALSTLYLDEYEQDVLRASIERFCALQERSFYQPEEYDGKLYFELPVQLFTRTLSVSIEVEGIDAVLFDIEELLV